MKKLLSTGAVFGVVVGLGLQAPAAMAEPTEPQIQKTSTPTPAVVGDTVEFAVTITGTPDTMVDVQEDVSDYRSHTHHDPLITEVFGADGPIDFNLNPLGELSLTGQLNSEGVFTYTYSIPIQEFGDGNLSSETCFSPLPIPMSVSEPALLPYSGVAASETVHENKEGEEDVTVEAISENQDLKIDEDSEESAESVAQTQEQEVQLEEEPTVTSDVDTFDESFEQYCVTLNVPIEPQPEEPGTSVPEEPVTPEPDKPVIPQQEKPTVDHEQAASNELANTGSDLHVGLIAGLAALLATVGVALMGMRSKTRKLTNTLP